MFANRFPELGLNVCRPPSDVERLSYCRSARVGALCASGGFVVGCHYIGLFYLWVHIHAGSREYMDFVLLLRGFVSFLLSFMVAFYCLITGLCYLFRLLPAYKSKRTGLRKMR
jgi:hypothetical protein